MLWFLLGFLLFLYLGVIFVVAWLSLHPPRTPVFSSPGAFCAPQEEIWLEPEPGIELSGWWVKAENARAVIVLCHGYVMNRAELAPVAFRLWQEGYSCLLFDFRAHGSSRGGICSIGDRERRDVAAACKLARLRAPNLPIILIGSSMGSAAAALALGDEPALADGLVLDSSYSVLKNAIPGWWRFIGGRAAVFLLWPVMSIAALLAHLNPAKVDVREALLKLDHIPIAVLHGDRDDLVVVSEAERNMEALPSSTRITWFAGCGHTEGRWLLPDQYWTAINQLIDAAIERSHYRS